MAYSETTNPNPNPNQTTAAESSTSSAETTTNNLNPNQTTTTTINKALNSQVENSLNHFKIVVKDNQVECFVVELVLHHLVVLKDIVLDFLLRLVVISSRLILVLWFDFVCFWGCLCYIFDI